MLNRFVLAHLAVMGANLIYGLNYTIAKEIMPEYILPFGFIFCRVTGAVILFWVFHKSFVREKIERKDLWRLAACGLFGVASNQLMFFYGLNLTTPINASIIMTINPVLVLVISAFLIKERITWTKVVGIVLGIIGAATLILFHRSLNFSSDTALGDTFIFLNALSYAIYLVIVKPLMKKYRPMTVIKWAFLFGFIYVLPFWLPRVSTNRLGKL